MCKPIFCCFLKLIMKIRAAFALIWVFAALIKLNTITYTHAAYIPSPSSKGKWQQQRPLKRLCLRPYLCPRQCLCIHPSLCPRPCLCLHRAYVHVSANVSTIARSPPVPMYPPDNLSMPCICYVLNLPRFTCQPCPCAVLVSAHA